MVYRIYLKALQWELLTQDYLQKIIFHSVCGIGLFIILLLQVPKGSYQFALFLIQMELSAFIVSLPATLILTVYHERHQE